MISALKTIFTYYYLNDFHFHEFQLMNIFDGELPKVFISFLNFMKNSKPTNFLVLILYRLYSNQLLRAIHKLYIFS